MENLPNPPLTVRSPPLSRSHPEAGNGSADAQGECTQLFTPLTVWQNLSSIGSADFCLFLWVWHFCTTFWWTVPSKDAKSSAYCCQHATFICGCVDHPKPPPRTSGKQPAPPLVPPVCWCQSPNLAILLPSKTSSVGAFQVSVGC